jgi:hypothetical protein
MLVDLSEILVSSEAIAAYIATAAVIVSVITYIFEKKRFRLSALMEAFRLLNDVKHKEARKVLYGESTNASYEILGLIERSYEELRRISATIVRSDFNEMATLMRHNIVQCSIFVEENWWIILRVWHEAEPEIKRRRDSDTAPQDYMKNFEEQKTKAEEHATKYHPVDLRKFKTWKEKNKS